MPRPLKCRLVCAAPRCTGFMPSGMSDCGEGAVVMSVDEYEALRLLDLEGLTQEECAAQMEIARSTVTNIYNSARRKLADALVNGKRLTIDGGNYRLCERAKAGHGGLCCRKGCKKHRKPPPPRREL